MALGAVRESGSGAGDGHPGAAPARRVPLSGPLDVAASLEPFRRSGDDHVDRWDGERLLRTLRVAGRPVAVRAVAAGTVAAPVLAFAVEPDAAEAGVSGDAVASALRATFVAASEAFRRLAARDPVIERLDARYPGLRPVLQPDVFTALVRSISAQQVNLAWAAVTRGRLAMAFGRRHEVAGEAVWSLDAGRLADASPAAIRALQFTTRKAEAIVGVAEAVASGRLDPERLATAPDQVVIDELTALRGVGRWTAEWILARTFGRPVVVAGDLGVRKAVARAYLGRPLASEDEVRHATAHWGAATPIAQVLVLRSLVD